MFCNRCGRQAEPGQAACAGCGADLALPEPTQLVETIEPGEPTQRIDLQPDDRADATAGDPTDDPGTVEARLPPPPPPPSAPPSGMTAAPPPPLPPPPSPGAPPDAPDPTPRPMVAPVAAPRLYDLAEDEPDLLRDTPAAPQWAATTTLPASTTQPLPASTTQPLPVTDPSIADDDRLLGGFRFGAVTALGVLTGMTALFGLFPRVIEIRTDARAPSFVTGDWFVGDLAGNLAAAMVVALVAMLVGVIGAGFGQRWAAGLAGGAGLAIAGLATVVVGLAERPLDAAIEAVSRPSAEAFTVTLTRDVAYWVLLAAGALGVLTFVVSLAQAGRDRSRGLNPWVAALGAVAAVIAASGPLIPEGTATVADNWSPSSGQPVWFVVGRLVQLGLLAYAGVIGFLLVRTYGLGLVIGGMTVPVWLAVSTVFELGDSTIGPGITNPGDTGAVDLHAVTIVGTTALVGLTVVALIAAAEQAARSSR